MIVNQYYVRPYIVSVYSYYHISCIMGMLLIFEHPPVPRFHIYTVVYL